MPPLSTTIGANVTPFMQAMKTVGDVAGKSGTVTASSLRQASKEIQIAMAAAQGAGLRTTFYANSLRLVNDQLAVLQVNQWKATESSEALALAQGKAALGMANKSDLALIASSAMMANITRLKGPMDAAKQGELARLFEITTAGGIGAAMGGGFGEGTIGQGGGASGIVRSLTSIVRETISGRYRLLAGSVTLLAQRLGLLGVVVKSTAQESIAAAVEENKLAVSMARTALEAEAKAAGSAAAIVPENAEAEATLNQALADEQMAIAARGAALAQAQKAAAAADAAAVQRAAATLSVGMWGWVALGVLAVGAAAFFVWRHFHNLAVEAKNLADALNPFKKKFTEEAEAMREGTKAAAEFNDWLKKQLDLREKESAVMDRQLRQLKEEFAARKELARLRGATAVQLEQMDEQELEASRKIANEALADAGKKLTAANVAAEAAAKKETEAESKGFPSVRGVTLKEATEVASKAGKIRDAVQEAMEESGPAKMLQRFKAQSAAGGGAGTVMGFPATEEETIGELGLGINQTTTVDQAIAKLTEYLGKKAFDIEPKGLDKMSISMEDAQANFRSTSGLMTALQDSAQKLKDAMASTKGTAEERKAEYTRVRERYDEILDALGVKRAYGPEIAALEGKRGGGRGEVTALERVGIGTPQVALLGVAQRHLAATLETNRILKDLSPEHQPRASALSGEKFVPTGFGD